MTQPPHPPPYEQPPQQEAVPGCWWHPNRQTSLHCVRCARPACPDCLREAAVGYQCIDCAQAGRQHGARALRRRGAGYGAIGAQSVAGARLSDRAIVTPTLIAVNVLVYVITAVQAQDLMHNDTSTLFADGVLWPAGMVLGDQWLRLFTSGFLHFGLLHIGMNMLALWILGRDVELVLGRVRFLAVYFVSMFGGAAAVFAFGDPLTGTAGASGAIYGLMGAILVAVLRLRLNPTSAIGIIVLNIVLSVSIPGISLLGHLGGLLVGVLAMLAMVYAPPKNRAAYQAGAMVLLAVALVGLVAFGDVRLADQLCTVHAVGC